MKEDLINALRAKFEADKLDAIARFRVYTERAVGIGEHPQITEEMANLVEQHASAQDNLDSLEVLEKHLG